MRLVKAIVEVTGLEVMWFARNLLSRHVDEIGVSNRELADGSFQGGGLAVIEDNDPEPVAGVILIARSTDGIQHYFVFFSAAGDENIHGRTFISGQSQLGSASFLQCHHSPAVVH